MRRNTPPKATCCRCHKSPKAHGLRFCHYCAGIIQREMRQSGYLEDSASRHYTDDRSERMARARQAA